MQIAKSTARLMVALLAGIGQPALAQPVAAPTVTPPSAWTVAPDQERGLAQIASTATDGKTRFAGGCNRLAGDGLIGAFSRYDGDGLRTDGENERVLFYVRGAEWQEAFAAQLRYVAGSGSWEIVKPLAPVFVNAFSRGGELAVVNGQRQEVFSFSLTGSTAAARAMRDACGFK